MGTENNAVKHGLSRHPVYSVWRAMLYRCENPKAINYKNYGGRGIKVCARWHDLHMFWEDMFPSWKAGLSIDRIDVNGNYEPKNCKWATAKQQARNKRDFINPELRKNLNEAGIEYRHYKCRVYAGWDDHKAQTTPLTR